MCSSLGNAVPNCAVFLGNLGQLLYHCQKFNRMIERIDELLDEIFR